MLKTFTQNLMTLTLLFGGYAQAQQQKDSLVDVICVSEYPSTSFIVKQDGDQIRVRVLHHNGARYAPFTESLLTPNDLPVIQERAGFIEKLGDDWEFSLPRSTCEVSGPMFFQCVGDGTSFQSNGYVVQPWGLSVTNVVQKTVMGTYTHKNLSLKMESGAPKKNYEVTMNYQDYECAPSYELKSNAKLQKRAKKIGLVD